MDILNAIHLASNITIIPHTSPDSDALGSCFAFKIILERMGKKADVYIEEQMPRYLAFMDVDYQIFDEKSVPASDMCLCIDCGDMSRLGDRKAIFEAAKVTVNIDHHKTNDYFADINIVDSGASSSGEICYNLLNDMHITLDKEVAVLLYAAISSDTGGFRYSNATPKTLMTVAKLLEFDIDFAKINRLLFDTESLAALKLKGLVSQNIRLYENGLIAVGSVTVDMLKECGIQDGEIENIVDIVRCVEGIEVAVSLKESKKGIRVSLRSNEWVDVSEIAAELGGGGHARAAGYVSDLTIAETERLVIEAIGRKLKG